MQKHQTKVMQKQTRKKWIIGLINFREAQNKEMEIASKNSKNGEKEHRPSIELLWPRPNNKKKKLLSPFKQLNARNHFSPSQTKH